MNISTANQNLAQLQAPTKAFRLAALAALLISIISYVVGLLNADIQLNEKGYYLCVILFGLFAAVSVQKSVRDKAEGIKTSKIYTYLACVATASAIALLCIGLVNANMLLSEKGFFGMAYTLGLFAAITVQKNVRDINFVKEQNESQNTLSKHNEQSSIKTNEQNPSITTD